MIYDSTQAVCVASATYDALKARFAELAPVEAAVRDERKAIRAELDRRDRDAAARARVGAMSEAEKDALLKVLSQ
ncbi:MAG: hypothetical protein ACM3SS_11560 [Rhodospirillaceae bacterium]